MSLDEVLRERLEPELVATPRYRTHRLVSTRIGLPFFEMCGIACCTLMSDLTAENIIAKHISQARYFP